MSQTNSFFYDIACPFALMASLRIEEIALRTGQNLEFVPVLLGGLYDLTNAVQGKAGSALDVPMADARRKIINDDFNIQIRRAGLANKFNYPSAHPMRTVDCMRLLAATPTSCRPRVTHALYNAYWCENLDMTSREVLLRVAKAAILPIPFVYNSEIFTDPLWADQLRSNTQKAFELGVFGVPTVFVPARNKLFFGSDRLPLLEAELLSLKLGKPVEDLGSIQNLIPRCIRTKTKLSEKTEMTFWFDFSSPWSYMGWTQLERLQSEFGSNLTIVLKPFLLGALFREIGTAMLPTAIGADSNKSRYVAMDTKNTVQFLNGINKSLNVESVDTYWNDAFPLRTVTSLRIAILEPNVIPIIYRAAWKHNKNIADDSVLVEVLNAGGFDGAALLAEITSGPRSSSIKQQLIANTQELIAKGGCGAPTFEVIDVEGKMRLCWGQDRMNVVEDILLGWNAETSTETATVGFVGTSGARL